MVVDHFKFTTSKSVFKIPSFQDGTLKINHTVSEEGGLGCVFGSFTRLLTFVHVPIHKDSRRFLRFAVQNRIFRFIALPFGITSGQRIFVKVISVVLAFLRSQQLHLHAYLDDWLIRENQKQKLEKAVQKSLTTHYLKNMSEERGRFARMVVSSTDLS